MKDLPTFNTMSATFGEMSGAALKLIQQYSQPRAFLKGELLVEAGGVCQ